MVTDKLKARIPHGISWVRFLALVNHTMVARGKPKQLYKSSQFPEMVDYLGKATIWLKKN